MEVIHESPNCLSKENDESRARNESLELMNKNLLKAEMNESKIQNFWNEISELKFELNELKQDQLENHFNISGLPQLSKDQSVDVFLKIARFLK